MRILWTNPELQEATFHVDHILPLSRGGQARAENLALACVSCSLRKGARSRGVDSKSGKRVALFNPRKMKWIDHFSTTDASVIVGKTAVGRATVEALGMNRPVIVAIRRELKKRKTE
ncbi:MAG TPA: HNH endonuclease signature motif containing protein [Planctomycetota bacterium]|nr:HNH endonuclease signature motif containing protein [Planctomycetota bacterium]